MPDQRRSINAGSSPVSSATSSSGRPLLAAGKTLSTKP
jgi:hypothetical protein